MSEGPQTIATKGIPVVYVNQALLSVSFNDIRVYLSEAAPAQLNINLKKGDPVSPEDPQVEPRISVVMCPEFARALSKAIGNAVEQYENVFGSLRTDPTSDQITKALEKK